MLDIFISKGFGFVEAVLLNKVYFMFTVKKIILLTKAKYIFDYSLRLRNCVLFALLWVSFIVCHQDCRFSSILCQVGFDLCQVGFSKKNSSPFGMHLSQVSQNTQSDKSILDRASELKYPTKIMLVAEQ